MLQEWPRWTANVTLNHENEPVAYKYVKLRADAAIIQVSLFARCLYSIDIIAKRATKACAAVGRALGRQPRN
jgi:hypothetical protein